MLKRIVMLMAVAALMVAMMATTALPAMAHSHHIGPFNIWHQDAKDRG